MTKIEKGTLGYKYCKECWHHIIDQADESDTFEDLQNKCSEMFGFYMNEKCDSHNPHVPDKSKFTHKLMEWNESQYNDYNLDLLRHDAAHVLAEAAKELYPDIQVTIGPAIADGFYYDFSREEPFTPEDLEAMEARMHEIVDRDEEVVREVWERDAAIALFRSMGEHYKAEIVSGIPDGEPITLYRQGGFVDLCRGPHSLSTGRLGHAFKLTKLAGAYWRGDSRREMLQRVYGTAWRDDKELKAYLRRLEEAERRDHRRLGRDLDLFHFQEEAAGMAFCIPRGGRCIASWKPICADGSKPRDTSRSGRRNSSTACCGRRPVTGRSSGRTCTPRSPRSGSSRSSR